MIKCDLCNDRLPQARDNVNDNLESRMKIIDEIDASFESDYDKSTYEQGPKATLMRLLSERIFIAVIQMINSLDLTFLS